VLLFATRWGIAFGGWTGVTPLFFPRQAGAFHFVVAAGYLIEWFRYRGVVLLIIAKSVAIAFLVVAGVAQGGPWAVWASAAGDALMAVAVLAAWRRRA
jgi:hypothetical protein